MPMEAEPSQPTDDEESPLDIGLLPWQLDALLRYDHIKWLNLIGGRGAGKSFLDPPRVFRWAEMSTELVWGLMAATDTDLQTMLAPIRAAADACHMEYRYESQAPQEWRDDWDQQGILYPPQRLRQGKFWIWRNGAHFFTGSIVNNAFTRAKGINFNGLYIAEFTEPGVTLKAILTLYAGLRCGRATLGADGTWQCRVPGHLHQLITAGNVPLDEPSHWIYKKDEELRRNEKQRIAEGKPRFYHLIEVPTRANPMTGEGYDDGLRAMYDADTYEEQTSGLLKRSVSLLVYRKFTDRNVWDTGSSWPEPKYSPARALHLWFDWNAAPAVAGFGHDLRLDEVPADERRKGKHYFGILGELFSGNNPMTTDEVAEALLVDGPRGGACIDCHHDLGKHLELHDGHHCSVCNWFRPNVTPKEYCSGMALPSPLATAARSKYLRVPSNWRGLSQHRGPIHIYGDANDGRGNAASIAGGSIKILRDILGDALGHAGDGQGGKLHFHIPAANPLVKHRVLAVNRGFVDGHNVATVFVHSRCEAHIADFREVVPDADGAPYKTHKSPSKRRTTADDYAQRTHISDAWGYHWSYRFPYLKPRSGGMPIGPESEDFGPMEREWVQP